jgi:WD40 repeat protein/tRNA A-37 threonylcarbamoyl transferase component Bud32
LLEEAIESRQGPSSTESNLTVLPDPDRSARVDQGGTQRGGAVLAQGAGGASGDTQRFRVVRLYRKGGLGEVYVAWDDQLNREVALKQIQEPHADDLLLQEKILLEAEITGGLEHPGIVPVHALGRSARGRPYYIMRFIRGESLEEAIQRFHHGKLTGDDPGERRLELRKLLGQFVDVCNAVAYAHSRGVIHRDLKPANVVLGKFGETLVADWGLAKAISMEEGAQSEDPPVRPQTRVEQFATRPGSIPGTPAYMSPEQASGLVERVGTSTDVYSLGATFYTLLTGHAPYSGQDHDEVLQKARTGVFPLPRAVNRSVPPPLEAICLKAMEREPEERYASPRELAEDIEHWLADERVLAWREPWRERIGRWARRHRAWVQAGAAAMIALTTISILAVGRIESARQNEISARTKEQAALKSEREQRTAADRRRREAERLSARLAMERGMTYVTQGDPNRGLVWLAQALKLTPEDDRELDRFLRSSLTAWSQLSNRLKAAPAVPGLSDPSHPSTTLLAGRYLLIATGTGAPQVWDLLAGARVGEIPVDGGIVLASGPCTQVLIRGDSPPPRLWDIATRRPVGPPLVDRGGRPITDGTGVAAFSADGRKILAGSSLRLLNGNAERVVMRVWDVTTGTALGKPLSLAGKSIARGSFSPDGTLVTASTGTAADVWEVASGVRVGVPFPCHPAPIAAAAFAPVGTLLATAGDEGTVRLWEATRGVPSGPAIEPAAHVSRVEFSLDGRTLLTEDDDGDVRLWEAATGRALGGPLAPPRREDAPAQPVAARGRFSTDGKLVVTVHARELLLWDARTGRAVGRPIPRDIPSPDLVVFSRDGSLLATTGLNGPTRTWSAATGRAAGKEISAAAKAIGFGRNGKTLATLGQDDRFQIWRIADGQPIGQPLPGFSGIAGGLFAPDGGAFLSIEKRRKARLIDARLIDVATGLPLGPVLEHPDRIEAVVISPDVKTVFIRCVSQARFWNARTGRPLWEGDDRIEDGLDPADLGSGHADVAFSADGTTIVTRVQQGNRNTLRAWDAARGSPKGPPIVVEDPLLRAEDLWLSPDGRSILVKARPSHWADNQTQLWRTDTGKPVGDPLVGRGLARLDADLARDGKTFATREADGLVQLWDAATRRPIGTPESGFPPLTERDRLQHRLQFSPDSKVVVNLVGTLATVLDARSGRVIGEPQGGGPSPNYIDRYYGFSPDGKALLLMDDHDKGVLIRLDSGRAIPLPSGCAPPFAFSPDSRRLMTAGPHVHPPTGRIWDVETGQPVGLTLNAGVSAVAFHPDGRILITGDGHGNVQLWNAETGEPQGKALAHPTHPIRLEIAADRKTLVVSLNPTVRQPVWLWELGAAFSPRIIPAFTPDWVWNQIGAGRGSQGPFSPSGRVFLTMTGGERPTYRMWDVSSGAEIGPTEPIRAVLLRPDDKAALLMSGKSGSWAMQHWDTVANRPLGQRWTIADRDMPRTIAWQPDGRAVLIGDFLLHSFRLVDPGTGQPLGPEIASKGARSLRFRDDGKTLLAVENDGTVRILDPTTGESVIPPCPGAGDTLYPDGQTYLARMKGGSLQLWNAITLEPLISPITNPYDQRPAAAVSADGKVLMTIHQDKNRIRLWETATGRPIGSPDGPINRDIFVRLERAGFAPAGRVAYALWTIDANFTQEIRTWEAATGRSLGSARIRAPREKLLGVRPDGKAVVVFQNADGAVRLRDVGQQSSSDPGPAPRVQGFAPVNSPSVELSLMSPDGTRLFTVEREKGQFRDVASGRRIGTPFPSPFRQWDSGRIPPLAGAAFSPDGRLLALGGVGGGVAPRVAREQLRLRGRFGGGQVQPEDTSQPPPVQPPGAFQFYDAVTGEAIGKPSSDSPGAEFLAFSADGSTLVVASSSGTAQAWSVERRQPIGPVLAHDDPIVAIAPSPDGKSLFVLTLHVQGRPPVAHYWDAVSGKPLGPLIGTFEALAVGFGADRTPFVFGYGSETLRLIDVATQKAIGQPIPLREEVRAIDVSPDGTALLTHCGTTAQMWDARTGRPRGGVIDQVRSIRFTPEGLVLATMIDDGEGREAIQLWSPQTGEPLGEPIPPPGQGKVQAISSMGRKAVILGKDSTARLWDLAGGGQIGESIDLAAPLDMARFSPEDSLVFISTADGAGRFWDVATAQPLGRSFAHAPKTPAAFSPDGRILSHAHPSDPSRTELLEVPAPMLGSSERIALWSQVVTGLELELGRGFRRLDRATIDRIERRLESLGGAPEPSRQQAGSGAAPAPLQPASSPPDDRPTLATESSRPALPARPEARPNAKALSAVRPAPAPPQTPARPLSSNAGQHATPRAAAPVVATKPGEGPIRASLSGAAIESPALVFTPDGTRVVKIGIRGDQSVKWFDAHTGDAIPSGIGRGCPRLEGGGNYPSLAFSPDGRQVALGGLAQNVQVWDMATEQKRPQREPLSEAVVVGYSADGERLIVAGQSVVVVYGSRRGEVIGRFDAENRVWAPRAISPDGTRIATLTGGETHVWDVPQRRKLLSIERLHPRAVAFSPDNRRLVTAQGGESIVKVWNLDTGKDPLVLDDHTKPVWSVAFSPDGQYIATAGEDGRAKVWDAKTGAVAFSFDDDSRKVTSVAFSSDGRRLVALNGQGRLRIWGAEAWAK